MKYISRENFYQNLDRDELFEVTYYRDGIAYQPKQTE